MSPPRIAIIDDSQEYLKFIEVALGKIAGGVSIVAFSRIEEAKEALVGEAWDLILCDINFDPEDEGDRQGLDLLRWLQANLPGAPVVMMTRYVDQGFREEAMALGAAGFLEKPILLGQLRELTQKFLSDD